MAPSNVSRLWRHVHWSFTVHGKTIFKCSVYKPNYSQALHDDEIGHEADSKWRHADFSAWWGGDDEQRM